ncbi:hypothetical protein DFJ73DRAFT_795075 [Zopfochytrium polystomum]|nr:hypothetical protein DFJ73DRAFT_795075 [Zopfochytrium polystomum]
MSLPPPATTAPTLTPTTTVNTTTTTTTTTAATTTTTSTHRRPYSYYGDSAAAASSSSSSSSSLVLPLLHLPPPAHSLPHLHEIALRHYHDEQQLQQLIALSLLAPSDMQITVPPPPPAPPQQSLSPLFTLTPALATESAAALAASALLPPAAEESDAAAVQLDALTTTAVARGADRRWSCETCRRRKRKCDGVRPVCGYCAMKGPPAACVYLGVKSKIDPRLAEKHQREIEAAKAEWAAKLAAVDPSWRVTPDTLTEMLLKASLQQNFLSPSSYPDVDDARPDLRDSAAHLPLRPGSDPSEQDILTEAYFRRRSCFIEIIHRQSYMMNRRSAPAPAFLQAAVCAVGAADGFLMSLSKDLAMYYYDFARSRALDACDSPSLENLQALLILAGLSAHLGKLSVGRMLFGFYVSVAGGRPSSPYNNATVKQICSDDVWLSDDPRDVDRIIPLAPENPIDVYLQIQSLHERIVEFSTKLSNADYLSDADDRRLRDLEDSLNRWPFMLPADISQQQQPPPHPSLALARLKHTLDKGVASAAAVSALVARMNALALLCPPFAFLPVVLAAYFLVIAAGAFDAVPADALLAAAAKHPAESFPRPDPAHPHAPREMIKPILEHLKAAQNDFPSMAAAFRAFSASCDIGWPGMPARADAAPASDPAGDRDDDDDDGDDDDDDRGDDQDDAPAVVVEESLLELAVWNWLQNPEVTSSFVGVAALAPLRRACLALQDLL